MTKSRWKGVHVASEFDLLIADLRKVQEQRGVGVEMTKALPASYPRQPPPPGPSRTKVPDAAEMDAMAADLNRMAKALNAHGAADQRQRGPKEFFKALSATRLDVEKRISGGKISADDAILVEAALNRIESRAAQLLAAEAPQ